MNQNEIKKNETIELEDLALTDEQQVAVKGGTIVLPDVLVTGFQHGGHPSVNQSVTRTGSIYTVTFGGTLS